MHSPVRIESHARDCLHSVWGQGAVTWSTTRTTFCPRNMCCGGQRNQHFFNMWKGKVDSVHSLFSSCRRQLTDTVQHGHSPQGKGIVFQRCWLPWLPVPAGKRHVNDRRVLPCAWGRWALCNMAAIAPYRPVDFLYMWILINENAKAHSSHVISLRYQLIFCNDFEETWKKRLFC